MWSLECIKFFDVVIIVDLPFPVSIGGNTVIRILANSITITYVYVCFTMSAVPPFSATGNAYLYPTPVPPCSHSPSDQLTWTRNPVWQRKLPLLPTLSALRALSPILIKLWSTGEFSWCDVQGLSPFIPIPFTLEKTGNGTKIFYLWRKPLQSHMRVCMMIDNHNLHIYI